MEFDIEEVRGDVLSLNLERLKAQIVAEVTERLAEEQRQSDRLGAARGLRTSARPDPRGMS